MRRVIITGGAVQIAYRKTGLLSKYITNFNAAANVKKCLKQI